MTTIANFEYVLNQAFSNIAILERLVECYTQEICSASTLYTPEMYATRYEQKRLVIQYLVSLEQLKKTSDQTIQILMGSDLITTKTDEEKRQFKNYAYHYQKISKENLSNCVMFLKSLIDLLNSMERNEIIKFPLGISQCEDMLKKMNELEGSNKQ